MSGVAIILLALFWGFFGGITLCLSADTAASSPGTELPNVLLIIGDDQGWTDFGFMGHPIVQTPHLDRLASEGLLFTRGYVPSSLCRPSLATIVTGLFPHQHKLTTNDPPDGLPRAETLRLREAQIRYIEQVPTLPRLLARKGYLSLQTGKWWEGHYRRGGFTHGMTHGDPSRGGRHGDEGLKIGREGLRPIFEFIEQAGGKPWFIWYAPFLPHTPHNPPADLLGKYRQKTDSLFVARYWAMCEWFDHTCGELIEYLERKGLSRNTLVVFCVDNGWIQDPASNNFAPKSKRSQYDGGIRTPIILRWPGVIPPARDESTPVSSVDLAPTILRVCSGEPTADMPGINLFDPAARAERSAVFGEVFLHSALDIHDPVKNLMYRWCVDGWWKLIVPHAPNVPAGKIELYDLKNDPHETVNLAVEKPQIMEQLRVRLEKWWAVP